MINKFDKSYKTIGEVVKILDLKSRSGQKTATHTIRFLEKEFKQIKPIILNGSRRYYDEKSINILKKVHFLLKEEGMTIKGVKRLLKDKDSLKLDEIPNHSINASILKNKLVKISNIIKSLKKD